MVWQNGSLFGTVTRGGRLSFPSSTTVPKSCIQSAEYVIQCVANGKTHQWKEGEDVKPHVHAKFGNKTIDVTLSTQFHIDGEGTTNYPFKALPAVGQGLAIVWSKKTDRAGFLMHFGAVIASGLDDKNNPVICITNVDEIIDKNIVMTSLTSSNTQIIASIDDFRGHDYADKGFTIGLLTTTP